MDEDEYDITQFLADNNSGDNSGMNPEVSVLENELSDLAALSDLQQRQFEKREFEELLRDDANGSPLFTVASESKGTTSIMNIVSRRKIRKLELCPLCGKVGMSNIGAGTKNKNGGKGSKYRKHCQACGNIFLINNKHEIERKLQIWRDDNPDFQDKDIPKEVIIEAFEITYAQIGVRAPYSCRKCGRPKKYCMHGKSNKSLQKSCSSASILNENDTVKMLPLQYHNIPVVGHNFESEDDNEQNNTQIEMEDGEISDNESRHEISLSDIREFMHKMTIQRMHKGYILTEALKMIKNIDNKSTVNDMYNEICEANLSQKETTQKETTQKETTQKETTQKETSDSDNDSEDYVPLFQRRKATQKAKEMNFTDRHPCKFDHRKSKSIFGKYVWFWGIDETLKCWRMVQILNKQAEQPHRYSLLLLLQDNDDDDMKEWVSDDGFFASDLDVNLNPVYDASENEINENKMLHEKIVHQFRGI